MGMVFLVLLESGVSLLHGRLAVSKDTGFKMQKSGNIVDHQKWRGTSV